MKHLKNLHFKAVGSAVQDCRVLQCEGVTPISLPTPFKSWPRTDEVLHVGYSVSLVQAEQPT